MMEEQGRNADGGSKSPDAIPLSVVALDSIEHHYMEVLKELSMDPQLEPFKEEYEKIHRLLRKSNEGEMMLLQKIKDLQEDLVKHAAKAEGALTLSKEDEDIIITLRKEIERAWLLADSAHSSEKESREHIQLLRKQVAELDALVDKSTRNSMGQETYLRDLIASKRQLESEFSVIQGKVSHLSDERDSCEKKLQGLQKEHDNTRSLLEGKLSGYETLLRDLSDTQRARESLEQQVREYHATSDQYMSQMEERKTATEELSAEEMRLKLLATQERDAVARLSKHLEEQQRRFKTEAGRLAVLEAQNTESKTEVPKLKATLKELHSEVSRLSLGVGKIRKNVNLQQVEMQKQLDTRNALVERTECMHNSIEERLQELEEEEKKLHEEEVLFKQMIPAKANLIEHNCRTENERAMMEGQRVMEEGKRRNLAQELDQLLRENEVLRKNIFMLEEGQTKTSDNGQQVALQYHQTLEQTRKQRDHMRLMQQQLSENEKRLKAQQDLLDRVRGERARAEKQLKESEHEWSSLKQRHQTNEEEIQLLKMQLIAKEEALCRLHMVRRQLQHDIASAQQRASHLKDDSVSANSRREVLEGEARQLMHLIAECDGEKIKYQSKFAALVNERNVLATQLIRRNEEVRLLYDKIRQQKSSLEKGITDYNTRVHYIAEKKQELVELRLRCRILLLRLRYTRKLQRRKQTIERDLFTEQKRSRALADELRRPVHVHRWRRLEGNAPEILEGIYKVSTLERQILQKQDMLAKKTSALAAHTTEYDAIRRKLASLPGPEVAEDLTLFSENLQRRREQMNAIDSELHEVEQHADVVAEEVKQLTLELGDVKRRYFDAKHKNELLRREQEAFRATWGESSAVPSIALMTASARHKQQQQQQQQQKQQNMYGRSDDDSSQAQASWAPLSEKDTRTCLWYTRTRERRQRIKQETQLVQLLSTGAPAPDFPLQYRSYQRQFVGGGFALSR